MAIHCMKNLPSMPHHPKEEYKDAVLRLQTHIPKQFVWPDEEKPCATAPEFQVPLIDLGGFPSVDLFAGIEAPRLIGEACRKHGLFLLVNHGFDSRLMADAHRYVDNFSELLLSEKQRAQRKLGEHCGYASSLTVRFSSKLPWKEMLSFCYSAEKNLSNVVEDYLLKAMGDELKAEKLCRNWVQGNCMYGEKCKYLHSWTLGEGIRLLTSLEGHQKVVSGITLPSGSDKLYSGSKDETVRVWDCASGQCVGVINIGGEVGCMISEGPWIFIGVTNFVKAWNTQTNTGLSLGGPVGQVYAMAVGNDLLFAGTQDGAILAWKFNAATNCFEPVASLKGHTLAVVSLVVGANRLYSGSMDNSIRVWSLETLRCIQILTEHTSVVMSLLCWDQFLLSCSLDKTIKVWVATENGNLEVTYTHNEEHEVLTLCGMPDSEGKPVLLCSCNDNSVRFYDLPAFFKRGKIFTKQEIRALQLGPGNLFFTGDGTGEVRVWQWWNGSTATS